MSARSVRIPLPRSALAPRATKGALQALPTVGNLKYTPPRPKDRPTVLAARRNAKMARSAHAYVRGNTVKFYEWLETSAGKVPEGPPVWICGDCHVGNLGPVANLQGRVDIQIRDLDQTVIGNPAHDLIRLALSLATAVRGCDLPGITTAHMMEHMIEGYCLQLEDEVLRKTRPKPDSKPVRRVLEMALRRRWKNLANERIEDVSPAIPRGDKFWDLGKKERKDLERLIDTPEVRHLVTSFHERDDDARVRLLDVAYWVKGCSSLGRLRYAVLIGVRGEKGEKDIAFIDIKEATTAAAPRTEDGKMPRDNAERVVEGARHLSPALGQRMLPGRLGERSVVVRELMPQDLKLEIDQLTREEAVRAARYLASVVGRAHARQMDDDTRSGWLKSLTTKHRKTRAAPSWLWTSVLDLVSSHEAAYLEHCRVHSLEEAA
jgi:uncharacterized protein (DUF2252 family)